MNNEQKRADFEAWYEKEMGESPRMAVDIYTPFASACWEAYQAGRAALQSQDAEVTTYTLPNGTTVERTMQRDGSFLWAVRDGFENCLSKSGEWDYEPFPSSRTEEWLDQHRFSSAREAIDHARRAEGDL